MSKQEAKLLIQDFDPSKDYHFQIIAVRGSEQSRALHAKHQGEKISASSASSFCSVSRFPCSSQQLLLWRHGPSSTSLPVLDLLGS